jgi:ligand-binding sensor domain-containing protein
MKHKLFNWTIFLALAIGFSSCNRQIKENLPKETVSKSKVIFVGQPKLVKTQNSLSGDNVHCSLQDKNGNLWFGTTGEGLYKYDGK